MFEFCLQRKIFTHGSRIVVFDCLNYADQEPEEILSKLYGYYDGSHLKKGAAGSKQKRYAHSESHGSSFLFRPDQSVQQYDQPILYAAASSFQGISDSLPDSGYLQHGKHDTESGHTPLLPYADTYPLSAGEIHSGNACSDDAVFPAGGCTYQ